MRVEPIDERFRSFGWDVVRIDGHDFDAILAALGELRPAGVGAPQVIIADTIKGRGVRMMEGSLNWHVGNLVGRDYDAVVTELQRGLSPAVASD
jgi:transketolase